MDALDLSVRLARLFEVEAEADLAPLFTAMAPEMAEWSINRPDDPRGAFRVSLWRPAMVPNPRVTSRLGFDFAHALWARTGRVSSHHGVGMAFRAGRERTRRFWALANTGAGAAVANAAVACEPALEPAFHLLSDVAGGARQCRAVSVEGKDDEVRRRTLYVSLSTPTAAVRALEAIGCRTGLRARLFFKGLLGMEPATDRPWPVLWLGRSVGADAGWKFYYFARSDPQRKEDRILLDLVDASPPLLEAWRWVAHANPHARAVVQFVGLTLRDAAPDAEPTWTVYLSPV